MNDAHFPRGNFLTRKLIFGNEGCRTTEESWRVDCCHDNERKRGRCFPETGHLSLSLSLSLSVRVTFIFPLPGEQKISCVKRDVARAIARLKLNLTSLLCHPQRSPLSPSRRLPPSLAPSFLFSLHSSLFPPSPFITLGRYENLSFAHTRRTVCVRAA